MTDTEALAERIRRGNATLNTEWQKARRMADDPAAWSAQMDKIERAFKKLDNLCLTLRYRGFTTCLYMKNYRRTVACWTDNGWFCWVCPRDSSQLAEGRLYEV